MKYKTKKLCQSINEEQNTKTYKIYLDTRTWNWKNSFVLYPKKKEASYHDRINMTEMVEYDRMKMTEMVEYDRKKMTKMCWIWPYLNFEHLT